MICLIPLLLATLTWTVPDSFFKVFPSNITKLGVFYGIVMIFFTWTVLSKNKTTFDDVGVYVLAALYIGLGFHYMAAIRAYPQNGLALLGYVFVVVWSTDIGAYMIGRKIGKHKLWPVTVIEVEPNIVSQIKTKEKDGYEAIQLAAFDKREKLANKPEMGQKEN